MDPSLSSGVFSENLLYRYFRLGFVRGINSGQEGEALFAS